ncbi:MAG: 4-hydroxythreonine-4-phosphate dehydrogenase [Sulfurospirillum sp.]|nr:MAG: 4-hydroxythreonine-4-phosphate dehydrogenase [Sulfurospirillum sp.]
MKIAVSIGDLNGIGAEIALLSHNEISKICNPLYIVDEDLIKSASKLLNLPIPNNFNTIPLNRDFTITPGKLSKESGEYSFRSFKQGCDLCDSKEVDALVTLPINKEAWHLAKINFSGHTDYLAHRYNKEAIMMLGCEEMFVALFTHHIPLKSVPKQIKKQELTRFLIDLYSQIKEKYIVVLGLNPHAGDGGILGDEESIIRSSIELANKKLDNDIFIGPLVPDTAFTPMMREKYRYFVAMYHDQGLIPLKALHFEESINVSLNLPIIRTSVDHGTAFDIAYKGKKPSSKSYINSIKEAIRLIHKKDHFVI